MTADRLVAGRSQLAALAVIISTTPAVAAQRPASPGDVKEYAPGLRLDWENRRVEIDAEVVLRQGSLELFACSLGTREHESILVTAPRPLRIHEAMGLMGWTPGRPTVFDEAADKWLPPTGHKLRIHVRWNDKSEKRSVGIAEWMEIATTDSPLPPQDWLFAGSLRTKDGRFAADLDGTVICVVDFPSALIALPELRSADNSQLWLRARTDAIPPIGTRVTLVVSAATQSVPRAAVEP